MKKILFKNLLLLLTAAVLQSNAFGQINSDEYQDQQSDYSDEGSNGSSPEESEQTARYGSVEYNETTDVAYYKPSISTSPEWPKNETSISATRPHYPSAQKTTSLSAPPDCPECLPDPGGDVTDVPLDRRLLVFLFASAGFVFIKSDKKEKKDEGEDPDKK